MTHPLSPHDAVLAGADVAPAAWLATLACRSPLALAPDGARGWFSGQAVVAFDPVAEGVISADDPRALHAAGDVLEAALGAQEPRLAVALLPYSGDVRWAMYERGLLRDACGWRAWGSEPEDGWQSLAHDASHQLSGSPDAESASPLATALSTTLDERAYRRAVDTVREAILDGGVYVLNLTRTIEARTDLGAATLFDALSRRAPAIMSAAWLQDEAPAIVSASPERFMRIRGHEIEIAPVKGTRPRGVANAQDDELAADLLGSAKERAEHVMIVDLERNDLGRVCVPGSVRVDPLFELETTSYCHQAVSSVRGLLRADASVGEALDATFPCGSVTGAPKIAAMRIAADLEPAERGAYTGSLVVAVPGELDSSILIRTAELEHGVVRYGTGCGITVESEPAEEWQESVLKSKPLLGITATTGGGPSVSLKETCRVARGTVPLWPYHRARLASGGCGDDLLDTIETRVVRAAAEWADAPTRRTRLTVVVHPDGVFEIEVGQRLSSLDVPGGVVVARVDIGLSPLLPPHAAKPADRRFWDDAHRTAEAVGAHQAVLVSPDGIVIDGSTACVWIAEGGGLVTPAAPPAIAGVSRAFVLDRAREDGVRAHVEPLSWERFQAADEACFTNAFGGASVVRGRSGPVFSLVKGFFNEAWRVDS